MDIGMLCLIALYGQCHCDDSGNHPIQSIFYPNHGYRKSPRLFFNEAWILYLPFQFQPLLWNTCIRSWLEDSYARAKIFQSCYSTLRLKGLLFKNVLHVKIFFLTWSITKLIQTKVIYYLPPMKAELISFPAQQQVC